MWYSVSRKPQSLIVHHHHLPLNNKNQIKFVVFFVDLVFFVLL